MTVKTCSFLTPRLLIKGWHSVTPDDCVDTDLAYVVTRVLTEQVTRTLPIPWQGPYTLERARDWIDERDREGTTLLVIARATKMPVGLMILFQLEREGSGGDELRFGYMLDSAVWGDGLGGELVQGFIRWCEEAGVATVVGGVATDNVASRRILEKNGFVRDPESESDDAEEHQYRLLLGI